MPVTDNDTQLLSIGKQCSHPSCLLIDFLPFKCQHCQESFCQEHFKAASHNCSKYDENKFNRIAPDCPFCNTPVAVRLGQNPNDRMEDHIAKECPVMTGKTDRARTMPVCSRTNCTKVLFQPILCDKCHKQFCPAHRFPTDHSCTPVPAPAPSQGVSKVLSSVNTKNLNSKVTVAGVSTLNAVKKATASAKAAIQGPEPEPSAPAASKPSAPSHTNPFSKTDSTLPSSVTLDEILTTFLTNHTEHIHDNKSVSTTTRLIDYNARAKAERESRLKAMRARAQKGLLSEEEKATLAAEEQAAKRKNDCIVM